MNESFYLKIIWKLHKTKLSGHKQYVPLENNGPIEATPTSLVHTYAIEIFLLEDMIKLLSLRMTAIKTPLWFKAEKREDIREDFYTTEALMRLVCKNSNQKLSHVITD